MIENPVISSFLNNNVKHVSFANNGSLHKFAMDFTIKPIVCELFNFIHI